MCTYTGGKERRRDEREIEEKITRKEDSKECCSEAKLYKSDSKFRGQACLLPSWLAAAWGGVDQRGVSKQSPAQGQKTEKTGRAQTS